MSSILTAELLHVGHYEEPKFDRQLIDNLVMDKKRVDILKALAKSFARVNNKEEPIGRASWTADFVKGKGNGLIFLLHGQPGVGKTCTAGMLIP
jgi:Cdc6-like AAA superfamily ATPase